jgi:TPR repeat protein
MMHALERNFAMYAPFWYFRAIAALDAGDKASAGEYLDEFDRVWRPALRRDPFKAGAAKIRAREMSESGAPSDAIAAHLTVLADNTQRENWVDNLFAGVMYYAIGDTAKARERISINVDFGVERDISGLALRNIDAGSLDAASFLDGAQTVIAAEMRGYGKTARDEALAERGLVAWFRGDAKTAVSLATEALDEEIGAQDPLPLHILLNIAASRPRALDMGAPGDAARLSRETAERLASAAPISYGALLPIAERYAETSGNAKTFLGEMLMAGLGVSVDAAKAAQLFKDPADAGDAYAASKLGEIFETADGLEDPAKAAHYYEIAARAGLPWAAMRLGDMCRAGLAPGGKNLEDAYAWYCLARLDGESRAQDAMDELEGKGLFKLKNVNSATVGRARARAREIYDARSR